MGSSLTNLFVFIFSLVETKGLLSEVENIISRVRFNLGEDNLGDIGGELNYVEQLIEAIKGRVEVYNAKQNTDEGNDYI